MPFIFQEVSRDLNSSMDTEQHNRLIKAKGNYSYFISNKNHSLRILNSAIGSLLIAYTNQDLAKQVFDLCLGNTHTLLELENTDMATFFDIVTREMDGIVGIILNLPLSFISGQDGFISNDIIIDHLFTKEEFSK